MSYEFSKYESAAKFTRNRLGLTRLSPQQKTEIQAAIARHNQRLENRPFRDISAMQSLIFKLNQQVAEAVTPIVKELYRMAASQWAGGETSISICISRKPKAHGETQKVWSRNGKWSGKNVNLHINVQPAWRKYVASVPGLTRVGGMLTTHATQIKDDCWQASWVRQGRGYELVSESGYIVQIGNEFFHGKTEASARKTAKNRASFEKVAQHLRHLTTVDQLIVEFGNFEVFRSDSIRSGNCNEGTDNWIEKHFPNKNHATIKEILSADSSPAVIAACKAAILRQRQQIRFPQNGDAVRGQRQPGLRDAVLGGV